MSRLTQTADSASVPVPVRELSVVSADGARVHVELHGPEDAPAVVLAHGWTCNTRFWDAQVRDLAVDHRVVVYDQRGHGRSPEAGPGGYSTRALADDLEAVLKATLEPGRKAVLGGHSMGGMTLMAAAGRAAVREHGAAVLLCSTGSSRLTAESLVLPLRAGALRTRLTAAVLGARAPLGPVNAVSKVILKYATMGRGSAPERVDTCARIVHACPRGARVAWGHVLAELDLEARVRELRLPTAVIAGTEDRLTPPVHARAVEAALPHSLGLTELAGMGHMTPVEAPEVVTAKLRELVASYVTLEGAGSAAEAVSEEEVA
ncbi:alpha/beta fold hydrolase [Streptomyces sp. NPDC052071]|uniref:Alpha/beta hydrolase fold protein n=1 Tax=Streptomyces pratensis (strain ATCC 33331 / IAF-45CD) TaxID=591167 RepID=A0A8D3WMK5_STRFA|nr:MULTISPECIES: alpha/beta fold hydrolase [Streptomyces]RAS26661.1 pimeloyl-ACP methyl ester carboxylesterase [Streptomyces avidinii]SNX79867.1 Pimeloyl-ACP methyl ester carboxylesterase [Streptomyces microflavus]MCY1680759.1 alpha/beta fold hydrolase [Streptomyces sp. SL294]MDF6063026.1 alpha/beta hydrolase [Streptomyces sp. JH010]MDX3185356.1 alpha/beta fold hydrolase [Streptomyces sp. ME02-7008A-1]